MARVTIEDCLKHVPNNFELVVLASVYAKGISNSLFDGNKPKSHVIALREIAEGRANPDELRKKLISSLDSSNVQDEDDFENEDESSSKEMEDAVNNLELLASENLSLDDKK